MMAIGISIIVCGLITWYFHVVMDTGTVFTHLFYIPIIISALWWQKKGVWVALVLGSFLMISHHTFRSSDAGINDYIRIIMFLAISLSAAFVSEKIRAKDEQLHHQAEDLRLLVAELESINRTIETEKQTLHNIMDKSPYGVALIDINDRYLFINHDFTRITGYLLEDIPTRADWFQKAYAEPVQRDRAIETWKRMRSGNKTDAEFGIVSKTGENRLIRFRAIGLPENQVLLTLNDITDQKRAEDELRRHKDNLEVMVQVRTAELEASNNRLKQEVADRVRVEDRLRESETRYRTLAEAARDIILIVNQSGRMTYANPEAVIVSGYSSEEILQMNLDLIFSETSIGTLMQKAVFGELDHCGQRFSISQLTTKTHEQIPVELSVSPVELKENSKSILIIGRDISWRKKMEADLIRIEKLESLGIMAGGIAHDFNNILMAITGNASLAKIYISESHKAHGLLASIEKAAMGASQLTRQFITFSKGGGPVTELTVIADLIRETAIFCLRGANVQCLFDIRTPDVQLEVDKGQLSQAIHNLVINARDAMPKGGAVTLRMAFADVLPNQPRFHMRPGNYLLIQVVDEGEGILPENLNRIFDPYFSTKTRGLEKGTGLGLTATYSIISKHGGYLFVESTYGKGATANIYLPCSELLQKITRRFEQTPESKKRILIMEDDDFVRNTTTEMLEALGYTAEPVDCGSSAVSLFKKRKEEGRPFDAVLLDLIIPGDLGGKEVLAELKTIYPDVKAIVSSGYAADPVMVDCRQYGFNKAIAKPYTLSALKEMLNDMLSRDIIN